MGSAGVNGAVLLGGRVWSKDSGPIDEAGLLESVSYRLCAERRAVIPVRVAIVARGDKLVLGLESKPSWSV